MRIKGAQMMKQHLCKPCFCYNFSSLLPHDDHAVTSWSYSSLNMLSPYDLLAYATCLTYVYLMTYMPMPHGLLVYIVV